MQTSAGPFLPYHPASMLPQKGPEAKLPTGHITHHSHSVRRFEFQIFFDWIYHDVLYIIARATFQKVPARNQNSNCCGYSLLETNAKDSLNLDLK